MNKLILIILFSCVFSHTANSAEKIDDEYCRKLATSIVIKNNLPVDVFPPIFDGCSDGARFASLAYSIDHDKTKSYKTKKEMIQSLIRTMRLDQPPITESDVVYMKIFSEAAVKQTEHLMNKGGN